MRKFLVLFIVTLVSQQASAQTGNGAKLPKTWTKDFFITLSFGGSMDGSRTDLRYTYDSCIYVRNSGMKAAKKDSFILTESDRTDILKRLHEMKVDKIRSEMSVSAVDDGWSISMCFGSRCVEGGTSAKMTDSDKDVFSNAYGYLEEYAMKKTRR